MDDVVLLTDLAPAPSRVVETRRGKIRVSEVSAGKIAEILASDPELRTMLSGGETGMGVLDLIGKGPTVMARLVAAGSGMDNDDGVRAALGLSAPDLAEAAAAVIDLSFHGGLASFFAKLRGLAGVDVALVRKAEKKAASPTKGLKVEPGEAKDPAMQAILAG